MFSGTSIDAATVRACRETECRVHADSPIVPRVGSPGTLAPGLPLDDACAPGGRFGQNAVVRRDRGATPQLVLLR